VCCLSAPACAACTAGTQTGVFCADVGVRGQGSAVFLQHIVPKAQWALLSFADPRHLIPDNFSVLPHTI